MSRADFDELETTRGTEFRMSAVSPRENSWNRPKEEQ